VHGQAPKSVAGAYLFLCRQFYNNGEGLQAIYSYDLQSVIAQGWKGVSYSNAMVHYQVHFFNVLLRHLVTLLVDLLSPRFVLKPGKLEFI